jgi:hypothetical protein
LDPSDLKSNIAASVEPADSLDGVLPLLSFFFSPLPPQAIIPMIPRQERITLIRLFISLLCYGD